MNKTENQKAWFFVLPVLMLVAFNAIVPLMTVVNYSVQETFGDNVFFWAGISLVRGCAALANAFTMRLDASSPFTFTDPAHRGAAGRHHRAGHAAQRHLGVGLPGADGDAAADPVERGRRDVEHFRLPEIGLLGKTLNTHGIRLQLYPPAGAAWFTFIVDGCLALDVIGGAAGLCRVWCRSPTPIIRPPRSTAHRLGDLPLHPVAEDETGADHRHPAALHGQLQHLHRAVRADRRRPRQFDHTLVHRPGEDRARPVRPWAGGCNVADLLPIILLMSWIFYTVMTQRRGEPMRRLTWLIPTIYILFLMLPIYWLVSMSFKTTNEILGFSRCFRRASRSTITRHLHRSDLVYGLCQLDHLRDRSTPCSRSAVACRRPTRSRATGSWATSICSSGC
jgi:hypothetical protein